MAKSVLLAAVVAGAALFTIWSCGTRAELSSDTEGEKETSEPQSASVGPPPARVRFGVVQEQTLQARTELVGRLREVKRAQVAAQQYGQLVAVPMEEGMQVAAGQTVLARIDDIWARLGFERATAQLEQAEAGVGEAEAELDRARRDRQYMDSLAATQSANFKEVDDARAAERVAEARLARAQADLLAAQAELHRAKVLLERAEVVAPFDGMVIRKMKEVGDWVHEGDPVVEIVSGGEIDAVIDVPEKWIDQVKLGSQVDVFVEPLQLDIAGEVVSINPEGSNAARTFVVKVRLDDQDGRLKPGMSVHAQVPTGEQVRVLTVPRDAVLRSSSGTVAWAEIGGVATPVPIKVLFGHGNLYAVRTVGEAGPVGTALSDHGRVVIEGAERLMPGQPLIAVESDR